MEVKVIKTAAAILLFLSFVPSANSAEILVDPSVIKVKNIIPGKKIPITGINDHFIHIINRTAYPGKYQIIIDSNQDSNRKILPGYSILPDPQWISLNSNVINVSANSTKEIGEVFIKIPKKRKYFNKQWQGFVRVIRKGPIGGVNLEIVIPLLIKTESKDFSFWEKLFPFL